MGRKISEKNKKVIQYLKLHPDAYGADGVEAYNNDPKFGKKYGEITCSQLAILRYRCKDALGLEATARGKKRVMNTERIMEFLREHPDACGERGAALYNSLPEYGIKEEMAITASKLISVRMKYRKELRLKDMRSRSPVPISEVDAFMADNRGIKDPEEMAALVKEKLGYETTPKFLRRRMRNIGFEMTDKGGKHRRQGMKAEAGRAYDEKIMPRYKSDAIVTPELLARAMMNSPYYKGLGRKEAMDNAAWAANFFGYSDTIADNMLEPSERAAFNMLEDAGLVKEIGSEHADVFYVSKSGRVSLINWRLFYWAYDKDRIIELANSFQDAKKGGREEENVYLTEELNEEWDKAFDRAGG